MHAIVATLFGPIFAKEMVEMARRKRYFFNRVFFGMVLLLALLIVWTEFARRFANMSGSTVTLMAEFAATQFLVLSWIQYLAVYLFVPLFLCGVVASEREEHSLELVFTTDLTNREIILGKLMSRICALFLLILTALPVVSLMMLFGGIDPAAIPRTLMATLLAIFYTAAHAIYFSATTKSALGALVRTYWWMSLWLIVVPLLTFMLAHATRSATIENAAMGAIATVNPIAPFVLAQDVPSYDRFGRALTTALTGFVSPRTASAVARWYFWGLFVLPALWSGFLVTRAVRRLRDEPSAAFGYLRSLKALRRWRPAPLVHAHRQRRRAERTWYGMPVHNPMWWRARLARIYDREGHVGRIQWLAWELVAFFFVLMAILEPRELKHDETTIAFLAPTYGVFAALTAIFAGSCFVGDRRRGILELIITSALTPREIVDGTFMAIWQHLRRLYWLILVMAVIFGVMTTTRPYGMVMSVITATLYCTLLTFHGMACSLVARTTPTALVMTFAFPLFFIVGVPFGAIALREAHGPALWILSPCLLLVTWVLVTVRKPNAVTVGMFFMAFHLCLMSVLTCWTYTGKTWDAHPMQDFHSAFLSLIALDNSFENEFRDHVKWFLVYPIYWFGLVLNVLWARWWLIRNFDRLVGRIRQRREEQAAVVRIIPREAAPAPVRV